MNAKIISNIGGSAVLEVVVDGRKFYVPVSVTEKDVHKQEARGNIDMRGRSIVNAGHVKAQELWSSENSMHIGDTTISFNKVTKRLRVKHDKGEWYNIGTMDNVSDDLAPTLGGDLDANGKAISGIRSLAISDSLATAKSGFLLGRSSIGAGNLEYLDIGTYLEVVGGKLNATKQEAFPIGSVFISVVATNPSTLLGYGTWSSFGAGRVLVGLDSSDANFDTVEETGGAKTVASAGSNATEKSHTHGVTSNVTVSNHAAHTHAVSGAPSATVAVQSGTGTTVATSAHGHGNTGNPSATLTHTVTNNTVTSATGDSHTHTFTGTATSVVQPYIVVYMWKRTA